MVLPEERASRATFTRCAAECATKLRAAATTPAALKALASLKAPVDAFFDSVMVMVKDARVRDNRLALLARCATR